MTHPILCTLFDSAYLAQGMALLRSVAEWHADYTLYVLAMDERVRREVLTVDDARVKVLPLEWFETDLLRRLRAERSKAEYCWTLTPFLTASLLSDFDMPHIAYIDADCYLFQPLEALYQEVVGAEAEVAIIPHRFPERLAWRAAANGTYNVGWVYFRNGPTAKACLRNWAAQCASWCAGRSERDPATARLRFGDQAYLDTWPIDYGAYTVQHRGANLAPWNQEQYSYRENVNFQVCDGGRIDNLLFYHFHSHAFSPTAQTFTRGGYRLRPSVIHSVYRPYEEDLRAHSNYLPS